MVLTLRLSCNHWPIAQNKYEDTLNKKYGSLKLATKQNYFQKAIKASMTFNYKQLYIVFCVVRHSKHNFNIFVPSSSISRKTYLVFLCHIHAQDYDIKLIYFAGIF
jgi:hypothetical protein